MDKILIKEFARIAESIESIEEAAKATHEALCEYCDRLEIPRSEVDIKTPEECAKVGRGHCWYVCFEAGGYRWAYNGSFILSGPHWYTEPYYSFDLCFEPA